MAIARVHFAHVDFKTRTRSAAKVAAPTRSSIVGEVGEAELSRIGSLIYQLGDGLEPATKALSDYCESMSWSASKFLDVAAVATGMELADMGHRGGFLKLMLNIGCSGEAASDLGQPGGARFALLHESFVAAVRPRLLACVERHQRERSN